MGGRRRHGLLAATLAAALSAAALAAQATGVSAPAVHIEPTLRPATPNRRTEVLFKVRLSGSDGSLPPPLKTARVYLPEGLTNLRVSWPTTLGCSRKVLLEKGAGGCPPRSQIGTGTALLGVEAGGVLERKQAQLSVFVGPTDGAYILNVLGELKGPLAERFVFTEQLASVSSPY